MSLPSGAMLIVEQRWPHGDCGIASLATYLGVTYEDVLIEATKVDRRALEHGLFHTNMIKVAKRLGHQLRLRRKYQLNDTTGILHVKGQHLNHYVILRDGEILDLRGPTWWEDAEVFLNHYEATPKGLLTLA